MTRDEYMQLLGNHTYAKDELGKAAREYRRAYDGLLAWVNGLQTRKIDPEHAEHGKGMIDALLARKQQEAYWRTEETRAREALVQQPVPPGVGA